MHHSSPALSRPSITLPGDKVMGPKNLSSGGVTFHHLRSGVCRNKYQFLNFVCAFVGYEPNLTVSLLQLFAQFLATNQNSVFNFWNRYTHKS